MAAGIIACSGEPLATRETGTLLGGAAGAAQVRWEVRPRGSSGMGAAIGGVGGTTVGYGTGNHMQSQADERYYCQRDY
jgi:hypothetical protein